MDAGQQNRAAAVAAATAGLAGFLHIPKGITLTIGALSIIVATGIEETTLATGRTFRVAGVMPKVQVSIAPPHTQKPIIILL